MKRIINGYGIIAVVCLMTAHVGADETIFSASATGILASEHVFRGQSTGIAFGAPSLLHNEKWPDEVTDFDSSLPSSWTMTGNNSFEFHADFFHHNYDLTITRKLLESLSFYYGVGGRMALLEPNPVKDDAEEDIRLGMRSPLGVSYVLNEKPVELFAEVVPIVDVLPEIRLGVGVGVGTRYTFSLL